MYKFSRNENHKHPNALKSKHRTKINEGENKSYSEQEAARFIVGGYIFLQLNKESDKRSCTEDKQKNKTTAPDRTHTRRRRMFVCMYVCVCVFKR